MRPAVRTFLCVIAVLGFGVSAVRGAEGEDAEPLATDGVAPKPDVLGDRFGEGRKKAVARFGGSPATESAVEAALAWLARHQEAAGFWDGSKWGGSERGGSVALTGLAASAFLGAGYTHKTGKYRDNVNRALKWLLSQQHDSGGVLGTERFRMTHRDGYNHPMGALAVVEAYAMTADPALKGPAQKTLDYATKVHQKPGSGWRYKPKQEGDICITTWFLQLLSSGKTAGLQVDAGAFQGAMALVDKLLSKKTGRSVYEKSQASPTALDYDSPTVKPERRTAMSVVCRRKLGVPQADRLLQLSCGRVVRCPPKWEQRDLYYWYYGSQACFQMGSGAWAKWNPAMKTALLNNQRKGGPMDGSENDVDGSWDSDKDAYGKRGGRVFTAAMGAMCLETYYRYALKK